MRDFQLPGRSPAYSTRAMAATSHPLATETAIGILRSGGTAADAVVAACAVLTIVEPHMVSAAGDCFWIVAKPGQPLEGYNGSGRTAAKSEYGWFKDKGYGPGIPEGDIHAFTVPGAVDGWDALVARHGKFGFDRLLARAIDVAENGHAVTPRAALDWRDYAHHGAADPGFRQHYLKGGKAPVAGDVHAHAALAKTYRMLAQKGARAMYEDEIAEDMVATARARGSFLTMDDFAAHRGEVVAPITGMYRGKTVAEIPPNGQGLTALVIMNILERFDMAALDPLSAERFHLELEATRIGYAVRDAHICEQGAMRVAPEALGAKAYAATLAGMISADKRIEQSALPPVPPENHTIYLSVVDQDGMAVSFICSVFRQFGVGVVTEKTGLVLQNRGASFRVIDGHPNAIGPAKRPMHTIIPGMVTENGELVASFGVMGGAYQACGHAHVLGNILDHGMDPQEALDAPRAFIDGPMTTAERTIPAKTLEGLAARGHKVTLPHGAIGGAQMIWRDRERAAVLARVGRADQHAALGY